MKRMSSLQCVGLLCVTILLGAKPLTPYELDKARASLAIAEAYQLRQAPDDNPDVPTPPACNCGGTKRSGDGLGPCVCIARDGVCNCPRTAPATAVPAKCNCQSGGVCTCQGGGKCQCAQVVEAPPEAAPPAAPVAAKTPEETPAPEQVAQGPTPPEPQEPPVRKPSYIDQFVQNKPYTQVFFGAEWCKYCPRVRSEIIPELKAAGYHALYVDGDDHPNALKYFGIDPNKDGYPIGVAIKGTTVMGKFRPENTWSGLKLLGLQPPAPRQQPQSQVAPPRYEYRCINGQCFRYEIKEVPGSQVPTTAGILQAPVVGAVPAWEPIQGPYQMQCYNGVLWKVPVRPLTVVRYELQPVNGIMQWVPVYTYGR